LPAHLATVLDLSGSPLSTGLDIQARDGTVVISRKGGRPGTAWTFPDA